MEYFILKLDENYTAPTIVVGADQLRDRTMKNTKWYDMPKYRTYPVRQDMQMVFTDVIFYPNFMVSEQARKTISLYDPFIRFLRVILTEHEKKISRKYYLPILDEVDCLTENSKFNLNKSMIHHAEIDENKIRGRKLFCVAGLNSKCVMIRADLAESFLRRKLVGIGLKEVTSSERD